MVYLMLKTLYPYALLESRKRPIVLLKYLKVTLFAFPDPTNFRKENKLMLVTIFTKYSHFQAIKTYRFAFIFLNCIGILTVEVITILTNNSLQMWKELEDLPQSFFWLRNPTANHLFSCIGHTVLIPPFFNITNSVSSEL